MGVDGLGELLKDRRTPFQKARDRFVMTVVVLALVAVFAVGVYHVGSAIFHAF